MHCSVVFTDFCSILKEKGRALGECRKIPFRPLIVVVLLLFFAPAVFSGGQGEGFSPEVDPAGDVVSLEGLSLDQIYDVIVDLPAEQQFGAIDQLTPEERLTIAGKLIEERKINLAIAILTGVVWEDPNQLERAEELFRKIRAINEEYVAKQEEVLAKLQELLSEEITEEELLPNCN